MKKRLLSMLLVFVMLLGILPVGAAAEGPGPGPGDTIYRNVTISVNASETLTGSGSYFGHNHSWSSADASIVTVSNSNNSQATITGKKAETTTITHTYWTGWEFNKQWHREIWNVTVKPTTSQTKSVYVYVKLYKMVNGQEVAATDDDLDHWGITKNSHGWITIGKIELDPSSITIPTDSYLSTDSTDTEHYNATLAAAINGIDRYVPNSGVDISHVKWKELHRVDTGADDYVSSPAWHLDGRLVIDPDADIVTITYQDGANGKVFTTEEHKAIKGTATPPFTGNLNRTGYTFAGWNPEVADTATENKTYTATWKANTKLTVTKTVEGLTSGALPQNFKINVTNQDGTTYTLEIKTSADTDPNANGVQYKGVISGKYTWEISNLDYDSWTVTEQNAEVTGYTLLDTSTTTADIILKNNGTEREKTAGLVNKYEAIPTNYNLTVSYVDDNASPTPLNFIEAEGGTKKNTETKQITAGGTWTVSPTETTANKTSFVSTTGTYTAPRTIIIGEGTDTTTYAYDPIATTSTLAGTNMSKNESVTLVYSLDANQDNIPDKYQVTVSFEAVHGTFEGNITSYTAVVTKYNEAGKWAVDGIAKLTDSDIKAANPADEYKGSGTWTKNGTAISEAPKAGYTVNNGDKFVVTFVSAVVSGASKSVVTDLTTVPTYVQSNIPSDTKYPETDNTGEQVSYKPLEVKVGDSVTLLYAITVTGEAGDSFAVTEEAGTTYLGADGVDGKVTIENGVYSGKLQGTSATLYFTKTFTIVATTTKLSNSAMVDGIQDPVSEEVPVRVMYTVSYLWDSSKPAECTDAPPANASVKQGDSYTVSTQTFGDVSGSKDGVPGTYKFEGWYIDDAKQTTITGVNDDITLIGKWSFTPNGQATVKVQYELYAVDDTTLLETITKYTNTDYIGKNYDVSNYTDNSITKDGETYTFESDNGVLYTGTIPAEGVTIIRKYKMDARYGLSVEKTVDKTKVMVGDTVTYTITVKNTGNAPLTNVVVSETFGGDVSKLTPMLPEGVTQVEPGKYQIATLAAGSSVEIKLAYKVGYRDIGKLTNSVTATCDNASDSDSSSDVTVNYYPPYIPSKPDLDRDPEHHVAYIIGYPDGTVRPENNITRAEVATIFFRLMTEDSRSAYMAQIGENVSFTDVNEGDWYYNAVYTLAEAGILNGYLDGTFKPNAPITRAEFAAVVARFYEDVATGECKFTDVPKEHWAAGYIALAEGKSLINGYPDGTFRPEQPITRAETMTLINRVLERAVKEDDMLEDMVTWSDNLPSAWYYEAVQEATNSHEYVRTEEKVEENGIKQEYCFEDWTKIEEVPDWAALEKSWAKVTDQ